MTETKRRIHEIDALRGFALFGILIVNILIFHAPYAHYSAFYGKFTGSEQFILESIISFASGKFLFIFAFLFGFGIVLQAKSLSHTFYSYFTRRMLVLLVIGAAHMFLLWFGDILSSYALLGLLSMLFVRQSKLVLLLSGILLLLFRPLYYLGVVLFEFPMVGMDGLPALDEFIRIYASGSYSEQFTLRLQEIHAFLPENLVWFIPKTLGAFLIGMFAARVKLTEIIAHNKLKFLLISILFVILFVVWNGVKLTIFNQFDLVETPLYRPMLISWVVLFETLLSAAYIFLLLLIFQHFQGLAKVFAKTGKLALTNYLFQTIICLFIFYSFGAQYYAKLAPSTLLLLSLGINGFNIIFSLIYLRYARMGPLETLWRALSK